MIISDTFDSFVAEHLSPSDYKELSMAMEADATKVNFTNSLLGRVVTSINRCIEDHSIKNDVFKASLATKGDITKSELFKVDVAKAFSKATDKTQVIFAKYLTNIYCFCNRVIVFKPIHKIFFMIY